MRYGTQGQRHFLHSTGFHKIQTFFSHLDLMETHSLEQPQKNQWRKTLQQVWITKRWITVLTKLSTTVDWNRSSTSPRRISSSLHTHQHPSLTSSHELLMYKIPLDPLNVTSTKSKESDDNKIIKQQKAKKTFCLLNNSICSSFSVGLVW